MMAEGRNSDDIVDYVKRGDIEGVMKCLDLGVDINQKDDNWNETLLGWAAEYERLEILKFLIYKGADINIPNAAGRTPLFYAALSGQNDAVKILLNNGADVSCRENSGMTTLHAAARSGSEATILTLIDCINTHDGNIDPVDDDGETPLSYAARRGFPDAVIKLCIAGSNVNGADPGGRPLIAAAGEGDKMIVEVLLDRGANPNMPDNGRRLPIY
ncbi:ankyrin repeat-containing domain protein [Xylaria scruposa]|nr:ankyrin repeat-containing domain protein [Xylaria scruposa]